MKEVKIRLAQAHGAMTTLAIHRKIKAIGFPTEIKLYKLIVLLILLYRRGSWTLMADLDRRIQAFENKCY